MVIAKHVMFSIQAVTYRGLLSPCSYSDNVLAGLRKTAVYVDDIIVGGRIRENT